MYPHWLQGRCDVLTKEQRSESLWLLLPNKSVGLKSGVVKTLTGEVPEDWRIASVVPLFKKGSKNNPGNYRPVSLTSVVGKLLERILRDRPYSHLEISGRIRERQHGFVKGRSCLTNLIEFFQRSDRDD